MKFVRKLPDVDEIIKQYSLSTEQIERRKCCVKELEAILSGKTRKKILFLGPCSADREDAVIEYVSRLAGLADKVKDRFVIIPRIYTSKPRTNGIGYKGLLHRPYTESGSDNLVDGIIATRQMHLHVIQQTGMFCIDEMLYSESIAYILDLLAYVAIGARSVEDQAHRLVASGLDIPVGMKNPVSGDLSVLLNSITAAQYPQSMLFRGYEVHTSGNEYAHAILRGYSDLNGYAHPNYHYEDLCVFYDRYQKANLKNISVIIDCNHANSGKRYDEQIRIAAEIVDSCKRNKTLDRFVKGIMIESYLEDGNQIIGGGVYGKSITDPCLGWNKTERLVYELAERL